MDIHNFLNQTDPLLDARSPSEFSHGHIPGAFSFPLFSDEERKQVGTTYKQEGKEIAVKLGLYFVGPKLLSFVEKAEELTGSEKRIRLYCARGGMRSSSLGWLLQTAGFKVTLLTDGYKAFRHWALSQFKISYPFLVLGGFTGTGKTDFLHQLKKQNEQIIDLEKIANHKGSSFGHIGESIQPSSEHFENILAGQLSQCDLNRPIWIEDESRMIGSCCLPQEFRQQMIQSPFLWIERPKEERLNHLLCTYGGYPAKEMIQATQRLQKKLGAVKTLQIVQSIQNNELEAAASAILEYYDKTYAHSCQKNPRKRTDFVYTGSAPLLINELIHFSQNL